MPSMRALRVLALGALLVALAYATLPASADVNAGPFLFMRDLRIGLEGVGRTTIGEGRPQLFQVRIVGLVDNPGDLNDYILVRSSGDLIREAGGYAQGMSGSPIYIDNKLIGAFFAAFLYDESPNPIGLVRPIEAMLKLVGAVQRAADAAQRKDDEGDEEEALWPLEEALRSVRWEDGQRRTVKVVSRPPELAERRAHPDTLYAVRTGTALWVSGLSGRALDWLKRGLDPRVFERAASALLPLRSPMELGLDRGFLEELQRGFEERYGAAMYPFAAASNSDVLGAFAPEEFKPGRPMAALLTNGDVTLGGVCTTSYVDPEAGVLLACGHQLFLTGESRLFLARAQVIDTVNSGPISFVLPRVDRAEVLGTILQDRVQAIGALLGRPPRSIRLTVRVRDITTDTVRDLTVNLADVSRFVPFLVFASLLQGVDTTLNRIGQGTMRVEYTIRGDNLPRRVGRADVFADFNDIAVFGPLQVAQTLFLLMQNEFADPQISRIDVDILTMKPVRLLQVVDVETDKEKYRPGETVRYTVTLRAYRGEERRIEGSLELPEELEARRLTLRVRGGLRRQQGAAQQASASQQQYGSLEDLLRAIEEATTNDQLTVELVGLTKGGGGEAFQEVRKLKDWVVTGEGRVTLEIERPKPQPKPQPKEQQQQDQTQTKPEKAKESEPEGKGKDPQQDDQPDQDQDQKQENDEQQKDNDSGDDGDGDQDKSEDGNGDEDDCNQLFYC